MICILRFCKCPICGAAGELEDAAAAAAASSQSTQQNGGPPADYRL